MSVPLIPSAPADLELIAQLKSKLRYTELRIRVLEERLRLMRIEKYGAGGEKLSHAQLELFEFEPVPCELIMEAESRPEPLHRSTKKSGKHPGRQELSANLPRVERVLPCTPDQRVQNAAENKQSCTSHLLFSIRPEGLRDRRQANGKK